MSDALTLDTTMKLVHDATKKAPKKKEPENVLEAVAMQLPPDPIDFDLSGCVRLLGENPDIRDNNDPTVLSGETELGFRRLIAAYGFDRLPFTHGEVMGLMDYVERFSTALIMRGLKPGPPGLPKWEESARKVFLRHHPQWVPALDLFIAGDIAGLRAHHRENDTLTKLGLGYEEPEGQEG